jgi:hypothetical protein
MSLEDWVDQEVTLTFENGVTETLKVERKENGSYKVGIFLYNSRGHILHRSANGAFAFKHPRNIVKMPKKVQETGMTTQISSSQKEPIVPFWTYVIKETGGRYDPRALRVVIETLKEWLPEPEEINEDDGIDMSEYICAQQDYQNTIIENLFPKGSVK